MASSIASLFGPTAEEIVYARQQEDKALRQQQLQQGLAMQSSPLAQQYYQAGYNIISGLGGLMGSAPMQDPRLGQAVKIRQLLGKTDIKDLNNPDKLDELSGTFAQQGLPEIALYLSDRATGLRSSAYERDFKERELSAKYSTVKPTDYRVLNEDGSISNVEQRGNNFYNSSTGEQITDFTKVMKAGELRPVKEASPATKTRLRSKFLKDTDFDDPVKLQIAQDIHERATRIVNESRGAIDMSEAEQQAWQQMLEDGVIVPAEFYKLNPLSDWEYNPQGKPVSEKKSIDAPIAKPNKSIRQERGLPSQVEGRTRTQIRRVVDPATNETVTLEILYDDDGNILYERRIN